MLRLRAAPSHRAPPRGPSLPVAALPSSDPVLSYNEVQSAARKLGVSLTTQTLGIFYRITVAPLQESQSEDIIYAYTDGFVLPFLQYMHCDKMEIYRNRVPSGDVLRSHPLWLGLLMCTATFAYAHEHGCRIAELLAINDDDFTTRRLVRSYRYFGFRTVRVIEGGWGDILEMMMWGGVGTKMQANVLDVLEKWTLSIRTISEGSQSL